MSRTDRDEHFGPPISPEEEAFHEAQEARGELAYHAESIGCYECGGFDGHSAPQRKVVALGPVVGRADPTQLYRLECGHLSM